MYELGVRFIKAGLVITGIVLVTAVMILILFGFWVFVKQIKIEVYKRRNR